MTGLEFSWRTDFKSVRDLWIWWRIEWDNWHWKRWRRNWFLKNFNFLQPQISQQKLHQIKHVGGVLESSRWADLKTAIGCQIWWRFHIEKGQKPLLQSKGGVLYHCITIPWQCLWMNVCLLILWLIVNCLLFSTLY